MYYLQCISRTCIAIWGVEFRDSWSTLQLTTAPSSLRSARKSSVLLTVNVFRFASSSFKYLTSERKNKRLQCFGEKESSIRKLNYLSQLKKQVFHICTGLFKTKSDWSYSLPCFDCKSWIYILKRDILKLVTGYCTHILIHRYYKICY